MIKLKRADGIIVDGEQDCTCVDIHDGPHWIYENDLWKARNQRLLDQGNTRGHIHEEVPRLKEKLWEMERRGIVEILRT